MLDDAGLAEGRGDNPAGDHERRGCGHRDERRHRTAEPAHGRPPFSGARRRGRLIFGRQLRMRVELRHDRALHVGGGLHRLDGETEQRRGVPKLGHLVASALGVREVRLELGELVGIHPVQGVRAGEVARVFVVSHEATPNSSRKRIIPSLMRVLIVPIGTLSRSATSLLV